MTEANTQILKGLADALQAKLNALSAAQADVAKYQALATEYQRQIDYHTQRGDTVDAENVAPLLNNTYSLLAGAQTKEKQAQTDYDTALANYKSTAKDILTPAELQAIDTQAQVDLENAKAAADKQKADSAQNYMSARAKYIIVGIVVLIIVVTVLYFKFRKKAA